MGCITTLGEKYTPIRVTSPCAPNISSRNTQSPLTVGCGQLGQGQAGIMEILNETQGIKKRVDAELSISRAIGKEKVLMRGTSVGALGRGGAGARLKAWCHGLALTKIQPMRGSSLQHFARL